MKNKLIRDWRKENLGQSQPQAPSIVVVQQPQAKPPPSIPKPGKKKKSKAGKAGNKPVKAGNKKVVQPMTREQVLDKLKSSTSLGSNLGTGNIPTLMTVREYKVSNGPARSVTDLMNRQDPDRRLASAFALIVSKAAEDLSGAPKPGDEFWDMEEIMRRKISHKALQQCRMTRDRERIILLLDTSPSCESVSEFYQKIAQIAAARDDVEIYDTPNGFVESRVFPDGRREKTPQHKGEVYVGISGMGWHHRTIIYFTDFDGTSQILLTEKQKNRIYWLNRLPDKDNYYETHVRNIQGFRGKTFWDVSNGTDLMGVARRLRGVGG